MPVMLLLVSANKSANRMRRILRSRVFALVNRFYDTARDFKESTESRKIIIKAGIHCITIYKLFINSRMINLSEN
jgi:hypothetical protein